MEETVLQINFRYHCPEVEMLQMASELVEPLLEVDGLIWKIWTHNPEVNMAGGVYLFENRSKAEAYANGPIGDEMRNHPDFSDLDIKFFGIMEEPSKATRAPI